MTKARRRARQRQSPWQKGATKKVSRDSHRAVRAGQATRWHKDLSDSSSGRKPRKAPSCSAARSLCAAQRESAECLLLCPKKVVKFLPLTAFKVDCCVCLRSCCTWQFMLMSRNNWLKHETKLKSLCHRAFEANPFRQIVLIVYDEQITFPSFNQRVGANFLWRLLAQGTEGFPQNLEDLTKSVSGILAEAMLLHPSTLTQDIFQISQLCLKIRGKIAT